jgi:hypothetical protein
MKKSWMYWVLALIITLVAASYQRMTGPTYPKTYNLKSGNETLKIKLIRTAETGKDAIVNIPAPKDAFGYIFYKRYHTNDAWTVLTLKNINDTLKAALPQQPPAGKLQYAVRLKLHSSDAWITEPPVVVRFKGSVPAWVLIPHILMMFLAMFFSNYTGLIAIGNRGNQFKWAIITFLILLVGGHFLGPIVQKYAFGELWTGIPYGWDLTDNKTLFASIGWLIAIIANWNTKHRGWFIFAAILTILVFSIPHSMFGSQLDYNSGAIKQG